MHRGRAGLAAVVVAAVAAAGPLAGRAEATHDDTLWVTIAINAAGDDQIGVSEDTHDPTDLAVLASDVAVALGHPLGTFEASEDYDGGDAVLDDKLLVPDGSGRLTYALDSGDLQVLAQRRSYDSVIVAVCTPRVRQLVDVLEAPQPAPMVLTPGSRCRGWYRVTDEPPVRAVVQLEPDRHRYSSAMGRTVGAAANVFALLGIGATLLRRGRMRRRSAVSWVLAVGSAVGVTLFGWALVTLLLWWKGVPADPVLLGGGGELEQVARTLLPGLIFLLPGLVPAAILLTVPPRDKRPPTTPPVDPPVVTWWPAAWWPQWAAQNGSPAATRAPPPAPPRPAGGSSGWALPGSGHG